MRTINRWSAVGVVILSLVMGAASQTGAQEKTTPQKDVATDKSAGGGPHEGIQVHGHWLIVVRDPDGREVSRREFENGLTNSGAIVLAGLLNRTAVLGHWNIDVGGDGVTGPCGTGLGLCSIAETGASMPTGANTTFNLQVSSPTFNALVLTGTTRATADAPIAFVQTAIDLCGSPAFQAAPNPSAPPASPCTTPSTGPNALQRYVFTQAADFGVQSVKANQSIDVKVTISFVHF